MPERFGDNGGGAEIHPEEAVSEKLALSDRFGISLGFYCLDQDQYLEVVRGYGRVRKIDIADGELRRLALLWAGSVGRRSGRSARQFIDDLEGRLLLEGSPF